jgi:transposase
LRGWSHGTTEQVLTGGTGAGGAARAGQQDAHDSQWAAIESIAGKIGCTAETLRKWVRQTERDEGKRAGLSTDERLRLRDLERENRELRRANEILGKASAYFAQAELDRRPK